MPIFNTVSEDKIDQGMLSEKNAKKVSFILDSYSTCAPSNFLYFYHIPTTPFISNRYRETRVHTRAHFGLRRPYRLEASAGVLQFPSFASSSLSTVCISPAACSNSFAASLLLQATLVNASMELFKESPIAEASERVRRTSTVKVDRSRHGRTVGDLLRS